MSSFVNVSNKLDPKADNKLNKLLVNDMKTKVKTLSELVSKQLDINEDKFDLMCFGRILLSDESLDVYGITNGTTVYVLNKINWNRLFDSSGTESNASKEKASQPEIQRMVIALRTALMSPKFRQELDQLSEVERRENLMAVTPGLREDPTTFAILQDPDLLTTLTEPTNIHKVLARHPALLEAATNLSASFHEDCIKESSSGGPSRAGLLGRGSASFNYSLDAMSDDEDMDETEMGAEQSAGNNITPQHIAEAINRAYQTHNQSAGNQSTSSGAITQDMLRQALQQSGQTASPQSAPVSEPSTSATTTSTSASSTAARLRSWSKQLSQMRDMGVNDDIVAIQALEATNGDVEAALNIIFSDSA